MIGAGLKPRPQPALDSIMLPPTEIKALTWRLLIHSLHCSGILLYEFL